MKNLLKSLFIGVAFALQAYTSSGAVATATFTTTNSFFQTQAHVTQAVVVNNTADILHLTLVDSPNSLTNWSSTTYTNTQSYVTNLIYSITNILGIVQTYTNSATFVVPNIVTGTTVNRSVLGILQIPGNSTVSVNYDLYANFGLLGVLSGTNSNGTVSITYSQAR